jgi:outer membrane scaffolding protein for murein synthesis (MipA/OmpV family)
MKKAAALALLAAFAAVNVSAAEAAGRWARGYGTYHAPHWHGRTVYSVYRSPRFVPPPPAPNIFWWEFFPTDRVNTHMY